MAFKIINIAVIVCFFALIISIANGHTEEESETKCGDNEEYLLCSGCEATCEQVLNAESLACTADCKPARCQCKQGYARSANGDCVFKLRCSSPCYPDPCGKEEICRPEPKQCVTTPCPQYACVKPVQDIPEDPCASNPCSKNKRCVVRDSTACEGKANCPGYKCERARKDAVPSRCLEPRKTGPCRAAFRHFLYNSETEQCEKFIYGGCQPNGNNFPTLDGCQAVCM